MNKTKGYDRIAFAYDFIANVFSFNQINKSQLAFLSQLSTQSTCLIIGGGTGYFLQKLLEQNETIYITYVEASANMISAAKQRIQKEIPEAFARVTFVCKNIEDFEWKQYDVIVCNYFLDLFDDASVEAFVVTFKQHINQDRLLYITDFTLQNKNSIIQWFTKIGLKILYCFFRWTTSISVNKLPQIEKILSAQGFTLLYSKKYLRGILTCRLYNIDGCI